MEFLMKNFEELFNYDYTKTMEDNLDKIKEGNKVWHELCKECDLQISECQSKIKTEKEEFKIDDTHTYIIGKYGPVIKQTISEDKVVFKSVKKDIDLNKLKNGEYSLNEIIEENKFTKNVLGRYEDEEIVLKKENMVFTQVLKAKIFHLNQYKKMNVKLH